MIVDKEVHELIKKSDDMLAEYLSSEGIDWRFVPPRTPNFGDLSEVAMKYFTYHFKRIVGGANLTYEELLTGIVQIEALLNSRPLSLMSMSLTLEF